MSRICEGSIGRNFKNAEAPAALEASAADADPVRSAEVNYDLREAGGLLEIDLAPFVRKLAKRPQHGMPVNAWAALFHEVLAAAWEAPGSRRTRQGYRAALVAMVDGAGGAMAAGALAGTGACEAGTFGP